MIQLLNKPLTRQLNLTINKFIYLFMIRLVQTLHELYIKEGDGFVLVYAVDDNDSFNGIKGIYNDIVNITTSMNGGDVPLTLPPILVAGNKCDLDDKVVKNEEVQEFCNTHGCDFLETSAKRNENINEIFSLLARRLVEQQGNLQKKNNCVIL
ncbi:Ras family GTPase [Entamoeba nuttalli P19]|uniref:Ras family GTPase n=1 Tax=Entamoeba nuttalli (strain P19) TaxID=1076696 RepID=K2GVB1_ENTNP|nr:Ras family GTPase [Entamoeba nuttalli P19]EKE37762.1 Ras family GTPase [Entamoeba nuttalli P19]|eukprot:XP_008859920.1 Ras family GTPase [Entamoeba nuttalli P19]